MSVPSISDCNIKGEKMAKALAGPEFTRALEAVLELAADRLHRSRSDGSASTGCLRILQMLTMCAKIFHLSLQDRIDFCRLIFRLLESLRLLNIRCLLARAGLDQQLLKGLNHTMLRVVAKLVQQRLDPCLRLPGLIGIKLPCQSPEMLAGMVEVQALESLRKAILHQAPDPDRSVGHHIDLTRLQQSTSDSPKSTRSVSGATATTFFSMIKRRPDSFCARSSRRKMTADLISRQLIRSALPTSGALPQLIPPALAQASHQA